MPVMSHQQLWKTRNDPLAVEGDAPEMEEDGDLHELDDCRCEFADPAGDNAEKQAPFG